jgi:hypothetical protein
MARYGFSFQEMQPFRDRLKIGVAFLDIGMTSSQVGSNEAETGIVEV